MDANIYPRKAALWGTEDSRLAYGWDLSDGAAKAEIKKYPQLQTQAASIKKLGGGFLIETIDISTGKQMQQAVIPEMDLSGGRRDVRAAYISGHYVIVRGEHHNTTLYSLDDGNKVGEFFGYFIAANAELGLVAAQDREGEVLVVDEHTGKQLQQFLLGSPVRAAEFIKDRRMLMVLTADQTLHRLKLPKQ